MIYMSEEIPMQVTGVGIFLPLVFNTLTQFLSLDVNLLCLYFKFYIS